VLEASAWDTVGLGARITRQGESIAQRSRRSQREIGVSGGSFCLGYHWPGCQNRAPRRKHRREEDWKKTKAVSGLGGCHPGLRPALPGPELSVRCVMPKSVLIAGCGFVGLPLARMFFSTGWETAALTASETSAASLHGQPFPVHALDITENDSFRRLARDRFDVVIHCASSGRGDANAYTAVFLAGTQNLMANLVYERLIFTSSTSVYAQQDGSWVDETSPADPAPKTGQILRQTEDLVLASEGTVARLGGLYGPGRCAPLKKLLEGRASIEEDGGRTMNTLHQLDAAAALHFLAGSESRGLFNVVDNEPVTEIDWFRYVCQRLNKPLPPNGPRNLDRKRGWTNKRVSNHRLRSLGWSPSYPTFREGLASVLEGVVTAC
jgi:nucleoside-diphosphate-sugar epimerase